MAIACGTETYVVQSRTLALERTLLEPVTFAKLEFITAARQKKKIDYKMSKHMENFKDISRHFASLNTTAFEGSLPEKQRRHTWGQSPV